MYALTFGKHCFITYHLPDWESDPGPRGFVDFHTIDSVGLRLSAYSADIYSRDSAKRKVHLGNAGLNQIKIICLPRLFTAF